MFSGGVNGASGRSLFCLPRVLRGVGRCNMWNTVDVDQVNAHFEAQIARHPGRAHVLHYVRHRKEVREEVVEATGVAAEGSKLLFLQLCYGGSAQSWAAEYNVTAEALPPFVEQFDVEQAAI